MEDEISYNEIKRLFRNVSDEDVAYLKNIYDVLPDGPVEIAVIAALLWQFLLNHDQFQILRQSYTSVFGHTMHKNNKIAFYTVLVDVLVKFSRNRIGQKYDCVLKSDVDPTLPTEERFQQYYGIIEQFIRKNRLQTQEDDVLPKRRRQRPPAPDLPTVRAAANEDDRSKFMRMSTYGIGSDNIIAHPGGWFIT